MKKLDGRIITGMYCSVYKSHYYFSNVEILKDLLLLFPGRFEIYDEELKNKIINLNVKNI